MSARPAAPKRAPAGARHGPSRRRAGRGASWVSLLLLLALAGGAYLAWVWVPAYIVHYEVKQVVRDYMNQAVKQPNDDALVSKMLERIGRLHTVAEEDEAGRRVERPTVTVDPRDVSWERDTTTTPAVLRVSLVYEQEIAYPWIDRITRHAFAVDLENELVVPRWGNER